MANHKAGRWNTVLAALARAVVGALAGAGLGALVSLGVAELLAVLIAPMAYSALPALLVVLGLLIGGVLGGALRLPLQPMLLIFFGSVSVILFVECVWR